jgi:hypothetical protein
MRRGERREIDLFRWRNLVVEFDILRDMGLA